ncbi:PhoH family protein [Paenibacillus vini]|uniref:PhoH family protein n=1 Tax=Paenibacillus vini TaxID=1476024 RepID=UPI003570F598
MSYLSEQLFNIKITLQNAAEGLSLFGPQDVFLKLVEKHLKASIVLRESEISVRGEEHEVERIQQLFEVLLELIRNGYILTERDVQYAIDLAKELRADQLLDLYKGEIAVTFRGKPLRVKTIGQKHYVTTIRKRDIVFGIGPAGTGKTYLAVVMAITALKEGAVKRIILTRPAVEAGENLGFLPGDLQEKVDPYLRPLYDALYDVMGPDQTAKALERGLIEIAPLAYMRGRTLDDSFIILDEAQNTTPEQMKMFLTRLGFGSKMVITGDVTQIDLPKGKKSGLNEARKILENIEEIGFVYFTESDVVRHSLVQKIIVAYDRAAENQG